ncbi:MAG TPA: beta-ketoacyl-ACP synthase III [Acidimicrobiales bacterium]|nr:beta-ketoacyl-ACP synthase III [Acidimicrobiales bacterium]
MSVGAAITGWGGALPANIVTNEDYSNRLDTTDEWIRERTGIRERRIGGTTGALSIEAGREAIECSGVDPGTIELLVLCTTTPDQTMPANAVDVHHTLGLSGGAYDLNAACAGFVYGLFAGYGALATGALSRVLVIGSDTMSTIVDQTERSTAVLFGDGAGAVVLESIPGEDRFLSWDLGVDGTARSILQADHGGYVTMEGKEVFRRAVRVTVESATAALERAKCTPDDIAMFIPHQANVRIIEAAAQRIGIPDGHTAVAMERTGNTSAASIPLALTEVAQAGHLHAGDLVLLSGFGAGMSWGSAVIRWGS